MELGVRKAGLRKCNLGKGTAIIKRIIIFNKHLLVTYGLILFDFVMNKQIILRGVVFRDI
jgi:hypothetical protein